MQKAPFLLALGLLLGLTTIQCNKPDEPIGPTVIEGTIVSRATQAPLESVNVQVEARRRIESGQYSTLSAGSAFSDAEGRFSVTIDEPEATDFLVVFSKTAYTQQLLSERVNIGRVNTYDIQMDTFILMDGWLRAIFRNTTGTYDHIYFEADALGYPLGANHWSDSYPLEIPVGEQQEKVYWMTGDKAHVLRWGFHWGQPDRIINEESIFFPKQDTTDVLIEY
jgi:hypothetical protein